MKHPLLTININLRGCDTAALLERLDKMATQDQVDQLTTTLNAAADRISTGLDGVRQDVADLKAANPTVDFSALEASVARVAGEADSLTELDAETPAAEPQV